MQKLKKYLNPYLISGILILLVVIISWIISPWEQTQGGILILSGQVIFSVIGLVDAGLGIYVSWKAIKDENNQTQQKNTNLFGAQSVTSGDNSPATSTYIEKEIHIHQPITPEVEKERAEKSKQRYLDAVIRRCQALNFTPLGKEANDVTLEQIYINLDSTEREPIEKNKRGKEELLTRFGIDKNTKAMPLLQAAARSEKLVLLGDPGSGKSTFVKYLCGWLAAAERHGSTPPEGFSGHLIPLILTLRNAAASLDIEGFEELPHDEQRQRMLAAFKQQLRNELSALDASESEKGLLEALLNGKCLLALDGLDEVPQDLRRRVRSFVEAISESYPLKRILVTCRIRSYSGSSELAGFDSSTLAPFDEEKIINFIEAWYNAGAEHYRPEELKDRKANLKEAALAKELLEMAGNPMLLTVMAIIHQQNVELPPEKVKLYQQAVQILLLRWQKHKSGEYSPSSRLQEFLKNERKVYPALYRLAYQAHRTGKDRKNSDAPELLRKDALDILERNECQCDDGYPLANEFLDYCDQRSGLFLGKGGAPGTPYSYTFPHRTFQEYLAGCYLAGQRYFDRTLRPLAAEGDIWNVAVQMAIEELYYNDLHNGKFALLDASYELCRPCNADDEFQQRLSLWAGQMSVLIERNPYENEEDQRKKSQVFVNIKPALVQALSCCLPPLERAEAGNALARLGDPRPEVMQVDEMRFSYIPEGNFRWNENNKDEETKLINLPAFWLAEYPVSVAQFKTFVAEEGYFDRRWWPEAIEAGHWNEKGFKGRYDEKHRTHPVTYQEPFDLPNHPVVGVSWYEARAFTHWLEQRWRDQGWLPESWQVTLSTERQWVKAVRGAERIPGENSSILYSVQHIKGTIAEYPDRIDNPQPQRAYPWGNEFDANLANTVECGLRATSALGCFPSGCSPYKNRELCGNVWEWQINWFDRDKDTKSLCGGSWINISRFAHVSHRYRDFPDYWFNDFGFRCALSPLS